LSKTKKAGVIPWSVDDEGVVRMMFMKSVKSPEKGWQIAKGNIAKDELTEDAAFREGNEELGLFKPNCTDIDSLGSFGTIHLYTTLVEDLNQFGDPDTEEVVATAWLTDDEFQNSGRSSQTHIVDAAYKSILEKLNKE